MFPLTRTYTDETADNLPGPGRGLDNLYQFLGQKLERGLGVVADKAGFGPAAAGRRVEKAALVAQYRRRSNGLLEKLKLEAAKRDVRQGCKALIKYSQWVSNVLNAFLLFFVCHHLIPFRSSKVSSPVDATVCTVNYSRSQNYPLLPHQYTLHRSRKHEEDILDYLSPTA